MTRVKHVSIGELSRLSGVGRETIRFYERKGLLKEPVRSASGYRLYSKEASQRLIFIKRAKALGFSLSEISELLSLRSSPSGSALQMKKKAEKKLAEVQDRIRGLENIESVLKKLIASCVGDASPLRACSILEALEGGEDE